MGTWGRPSTEVSVRVQYIVLLEPSSSLWTLETFVLSAAERSHVLFSSPQPQKEHHDKWVVDAEVTAR